VDIRFFDEEIIKSEEARSLKTAATIVVYDPCSRKSFK
jgi:hypothetical protein